MLYMQFVYALVNKPILTFYIYCFSLQTVEPKQISKEGIFINPK